VKVAVWERRKPRCFPAGEDERQYVGWNGQTWTTHEALAAKYELRLEDDAGLFGVSLPDKAWVHRPSSRIRFWSGDEHPLSDAVTLIRCGGHFPGSAAIHWRDEPRAGGALFPGDALQVVFDRRHVTFMYSYPAYASCPFASSRSCARDVPAASGIECDGHSGGCPPRHRTHRVIRWSRG
jgi:hypothetical protein